MSGLADRPLPVSETFLSLQGEGSLTGVPSYFVRLSGCNLRCRWCDTPYASWAPEQTPRTIDDLRAEAVATGVQHAVLTGGEPMIHEGLGPLSRAFRDAGMHVTIETAGTVFRGPDDVACYLMSISPKLANATPEPCDPRDPDGRWRILHEQRRWQPAALQQLLDAFGSRQLKFVVTGESDLLEIDAMLGRLVGWRAMDIMLMPEGTRTPEPDAVAWVVQQCLRRGWRYCHRLHVELFGDARGT